MKYDEVILNLENIIENWYDKEYLKGFIIHSTEGLCDNILSSEPLVHIPDECFYSWKYFNDDIMFPVGKCSEYYNGLLEPYSLFNNPKRLHLAVHMLQWLKQHNV